MSSDLRSDLTEKPVPLEPRQIRILAWLAAACAIVFAVLLRQRIAHSLESPTPFDLVVLAWSVLLIAYLAVKRSRLVFCYVLPLIVVIGALGGDANSRIGACVHIFLTSVVVAAFVHGAVFFEKEPS